MTPAEPYASTLLAAAVAAVLLLAQLLVADVAGIRAGHAPGSPVAPDPGNFLFRAVRAHANTNESIAAFALLVVAGVLGGAAPSTLATASWCWVGARAVHMLAYWAGVALLRSAAFLVSFLALLGMTAVVVHRLLEIA